LKQFQEEYDENNLMEDKDFEYVPDNHVTCEQVLNHCQECDYCKNILIEQLKNSPYDQNDDKWYLKEPKINLMNLGCIILIGVTLWMIFNKK